MKIGFLKIFPLLLRLLHENWVFKDFSSAAAVAPPQPFWQKILTFKFW